MEQEDHPLKESFEMIFACKKCKKCFRKDVKEFEEADEFCPHCDNHFVIDAKTPQAALSIESDDVRMDNKMLKDERQKQQTRGIRSIFDPSNDADKLG
jgi:acetyl-CoA carboxylase beta subunit